MTIKQRIIHKAFRVVNASYNHLKQAQKAPEFYNMSSIARKIIQEDDKPLDQFIKDKESM